MLLETELKKALKQRNADFVYFADISKLPVKENKGFPNAVVTGVALSPKYLQKITVSPDYVQNMILNNLTDMDEFHNKEIFIDRLADYIAGFLSAKGFSAFSQSEDHLEMTGNYNKTTKRTPLPHKTVAGLAGLGWIGKNNLLISPDYGSAFCMCTVLTDAPLITVFNPPAAPECGSCTICIEICPKNALTGNNWNLNVKREELIDVFKCNSCLKCLVFCPWTQKYIQKISVD